MLVGVNVLATTDPEIANEWDYERNGNITPREVVRTSRKVYWWKGLADIHGRQKYPSEP